MSASSLPYHLRPNKAVDRELFLSLLGRLQAILLLEGHEYISLGGPFLEDFRLVHARTGIDRMVCVESAKDVHERQKFNRPTAQIQCVHATLDEYLREKEYERPVVLWLDYTDPSAWQQQIDSFCQQVAAVPLGSIVRLTLNANPSSLGTPATGETVPDLLAGSEKPTLQEWRLKRFRRRVPDATPFALEPDEMTNQRFGRTLLRSVRLALERQLEGYFDRETVWALATHYSDGQAMVTATVVVVNPKDTDVTHAVAPWPFRSEPGDPLIVDLPGLSTLERLTLEGCADPSTALPYTLPNARLKADPLEAFSRFCRVFPHFARVDL